MEKIGIICEYNPFHKGHMYHINKIKELYPNSIIVLIMSSHFLERGEVSLINKWDKTRIALNNNIDLVIELPFMFSSQSADIFSYGALKLLDSLKVDKIVFGSELNDIELLKDVALKSMNLDIKSNLDKGLSYPSAFYKSIDTELDSNDILGVSYIKEIFKNNYNITPICIKRTNNYLSNERNSEIVSASAIRNALKDNVDVCKYVPTDVIPYLNNIHTIDDYFDLIKYKIISCDYLSDIQTVDEGIENRLKKFIYSSNNIDELVNKVKTKRYTYNKIRRMLIHILVDFKKTDAFNKVTYIRVLGFNKKGMSYLNGIKKNIDLPIITNCNNEYAKLELKVTSIYDSSLVKYEYNKKPIIKGD